ncbi:hypothetical protein EDC96DRAFT_549011 [Choanephora cucurbitarum]|nr:hypothetical protein EDC96DRAFT_549011 [Choanephora cucurbitarum]
MLDLLVKEEQKKFVISEEAPFLLVFVHRFIEELKITNESSESLRHTLRRRHKDLLSLYRQEMDAEVYGTLDSSTFRCLLKKRWMCHGNNVIDKLSSLRTSAVLAKEQGKKLSAVQKLMLNHIYFVSGRRQKSVGKSLPLHVHLFLNNLNSRALPTVPDVVKAWVNQLEEIKANFIEEEASLEDQLTKLLSKKTLSFLVQASEADDDVLVTYSRVLNEVVASHKRWCLEEMAETMFISLFFSPIARNTFERLNANVFKVDMQDKHMNGYAVKPDYLVSLFSGSGEELNIYSMEAKTPEANKGDLDFVKLANTMKVMVDELVSRGCPLPKAHSFGTLLHGDTMISYEMSLENEGIYIMKELNAVQMPCLIGDLSLLLPMINDMINICEKIKEQAEAIVASREEKITFSKGPSSLSEA